MSKEKPDHRKGEIDVIREKLKEDDGTIHADDLPEPLSRISPPDQRGYIDLQFNKGVANLATSEHRKLCVYCNAPWSPEMEEAYLGSGYCGSCYEAEAKIFIACSKCRKVVYIK